MVRKASRHDSLERATRTTAGLACVIGVGAIGAACGSIDGSVFAGETSGAGGGTSTSSTSASSSTTTSSSTSTSSSTTSTSSSGSPPVGCGNGVLDPGEICDGADLNGHSCTELGYANPAGLTCAAACTLEQSGCKPVCGNGQVEPTEQCDDGNTGNGDGCSSACTMEAPAQGTTCGNAIPIDGGHHLRRGPDYGGISRFLYGDASTEPGYTGA